MARGILYYCAPTTYHPIYIVGSMRSGKLLTDVMARQQGHQQKEGQAGASGIVFNVSESKPEEVSSHFERPLAWPDQIGCNKG